MTCAILTCERPTHTRGYCSSHYRRRLHTGRYGYRDATAAREHVARLRTLGWTWSGIAQCAGLSSWVPLNLHTGKTRRLLHESERALLSVPLWHVESHRGVSAVGSRRRVQALAYIGWPSHEVARLIGCSPRSLPTLLSRGSLSVRLSMRIATVYANLSRTNGPSKISAIKARQFGFSPPSAWIVETIDDAEANPIVPVNR